MTPRLHVELSGHGFGHLAQTAPVLNALRRRLPGLHLSLRSALPRDVLASHLEGGFTHIEEAVDIGMLMDSAVDVRAADSAAAYRARHARRREDLAACEALYARVRPDLVLVNAPWLPLEACARAHLPAMALCSLDWATVLETYCADEPGIGDVLEHARACYRLARPFLRPQPARDDIPFIECHAVGPIARIGRDRRAEIEAHYPQTRGRRLVLVALGGIATTLPTGCWPRLPGVHYIAPQPLPPGRDDWLSVSVPGCTFIDMLRSVDAVITKPGYGTFVEAVCNATRVLYSPRPDWPEEPWLSDWLERHGTAQALARERLWGGDFGDELMALLSRPRHTPCAPSGIEEAADVLARQWD